MILIDDREIVQHPEIPELLQIESRVERLEAADFAFLNYAKEPVGIERSEIGNLIEKLRSGELEDQMNKCQENYSSVILLKEGVYDEVGGLLSTYKGGNKGYFRVHVFPRTTYEEIKAMEIRLSEMGIEIVDSPNFKCSMDIVRLIYDQRTKAEASHSLFKRTRVVRLPTKLTNNPSVSKLMGLIPRLSEKVAIRLIYQYDSIWNVIHAEDEELKRVEGVSTGTISKLKDSLGKPEGGSSG